MQDDQHADLKPDLKSDIYDIGLIGLGAMGAAASYALSQTGLSLIGFDRHLPPHQLGSSHGLTRVIREAYFEHPAYVPLLQRAYPLWQALEVASASLRPADESLLTLTGGLMIGPADGELVTGCLDSARQFELEHELLSGDILHQRTPAFKLPEGFAAVAEPRTGYLHPERCIKAQLALARQAGVQIVAPSEVLSWEALDQGFLIHTAEASHQVKKLVISAGAWLGRLVPELQLPLQVTRQTLFWFDTPAPELFGLGTFPVFLLEYTPGRYLYGFPDDGSGFKVAIHAPGETLDPDTLASQTVTDAEIADMQALLMEYLPQAVGPVVKTAVCMYTNTPDHHFLIDTHPQHQDLLLVSPCSGHGYKFAAVVGEIVADWALGLAQRQDLSLFALPRLSLK